MSALALGDNFFVRRTPIERKNERHPSWAVCGWSFGWGFALGTIGEITGIQPYQSVKRLKKVWVRIECPFYDNRGRLWLDSATHRPLTHLYPSRREISEQFYISRSVPFFEVALLVHEDDIC